MSQIRKQSTSVQVKQLLHCYSKNEIEQEYIQDAREIKRRRLFVLLKQYKEDPQHFTTQYQRATPPRIISPDIEQNILKELTIEKKIIQNKEIPLKSHNYSHIR